MKQVEDFIEVKNKKIVHCRLDARLHSILIKKAKEMKCSLTNLIEAFARSLDSKKK